MLDEGLEDNEKADFVPQAFDALRKVKPHDSKPEVLLLPGFHL